MKKLIISLLLGLFFMFTSFANTNADNPTEADIKTFFNHLADDSENGICKIETIDKHIDNAYATFKYNNLLLRLYDGFVKSAGTKTSEYESLMNTINILKGVKKVKNSKKNTFIIAFLADIFECKIKLLKN